MSLTIFHSFMDLPYELRLQIWQLAIRALNYDGAVHRFRIGSDLEELDRANDSTLYRRGDGIFTGEHNKLIVESAFERGYRNHSAYLWDAGLWTACAESRRLIRKHHKIDQRIQKERDRENGYRDSISADGFDHKARDQYWYIVDFPTIKTVGRKDKGWQVMFKPYDYIILLDLDDQISSDKLRQFMNDLCVLNGVRTLGRSLP